MTDDPVLAATQKFIDAVDTRMTALKNEIQELLDELRTRAAPSVIEGPPGKDGKDGVDGRGIEGLRIQDDGTLAVRYTDKTEVYTVGKVVGKDGKDGAPGIGERGADGKDGKDGAPSTVPGPKGDPGERGADGIATREELESLIEARFADLQVRSLADTYQGTFDQAKTYGRGQIVSWDGQPWLAMTETRATPGASSDWKLFAKKGRDGRDRKDPYLR